MAVGSQTSRIACTNETCNNRSVCWFSAQSSCQTAAALLSIFDELVQSHPPHRQLFIVYSDIKIKHNTWFWRKYSTELYLHIHVSEPVHCYNMYYYALHQGSPHIHAYLTIPACSAVPPIFSPKNLQSHIILATMRFTVATVWFTQNVSCNIYTYPR